eukprot:5731000-Amphidinium_carterae.1
MVRCIRSGTTKSCTLLQTLNPISDSHSTTFSSANQQGNNAGPLGTDSSGKCKSDSGKGRLGTALRRLR